MLAWYGEWPPKFVCYGHHFNEPSRNRRRRCGNGWRSNAGEKKKNVNDCVCAIMSVNYDFVSFGSLAEFIEGSLNCDLYPKLMMVRARMGEALCERVKS